jgi:2-polyprenyl-6-methoxyphenol hydroxylase-like FAD-dependent oxidoreductase
MNSISIIGAGIGGLTLGNFLQQQNLDFTIYESAPEIKPVGAGIMMAVNAMQIFDKLGLKEKIENAGNKIHGISISDEKLKTISTTNVLALEKKFNSCNVAIHRADLQNILAENIGFENIKLDHQLNKIEKQENYHLNVENGNEIESRIVFGAEGIHSKVRTQILQKGNIRNAKQKCWRGLTNFDLPEQYFHHALEIWGKGKRFGFVKLTENKVYWYALINHDNFTESIDLTETFGDFDPLVLQILETTKPENIILNDIIDLAPIPKWYFENLCLIGDAAHATTPNMGQGACQSIEDAYIIGKLLEKSKDFNFVFQEFQKIRRKKVESIVSTSWKIGKLSQWEYGNSIRNFLMRSIPQSINQKMIEKILKLEM